MRFVAQSKITKDTLSSIFSVMIYWTIRRKTQYQCPPVIKQAAVLIALPHKVGAAASFL